MDDVAGIGVRIGLLRVSSGTPHELASGLLALFSEASRTEVPERGGMSR